MPSKNCKCGCAKMRGFNHVPPVNTKPYKRGTSAYNAALERLGKQAGKTFVEGRPALVSCKL